MTSRILVFANKLLIKLLRLVGRNGSALPGLIIERIYPRFLEKNLKQVEKKIIIITGTNGKTTTTKMLVTALRATGKAVITNNTGSNMTRGLISTIVEDMSYFGSLKPTDWFVFEMDEAYAPIFTSNIHPKIVLGLNVLRDQLDRYGEIDKTAELIERAASKSEFYVYNLLDPLLTKASVNLKSRKSLSFAINSSLASHVENEQSLHNKQITTTGLDNADVVLESLDSVDDMQKLVIKIANPDNKLEFMIPVEGFHNALNATAAIAAASLMLSNDELQTSAHSLAHMQPPFGRGEKLHLKGKNVTVALVKNPSGFMSNLETFVRVAPTDAILFVINDQFADGRDVSWLWDVSFSEMLNSKKAKAILTSGNRGYDMALRLKYDNIDAKITTNIKRAVSDIMNSDHKNITIIPTYTALFEVRTSLSKYGKVPRIW